MRHEAAYLGKHLRSIRQKKGGKKGGEIKTSRGAAGVCDATTLEGGDFHLIMFSESQGCRKFFFYLKRAEQRGW